MAVTQVPGEGCPSTLPGMGLPPTRRDDTLGATTATSTARAMPPWKAQQRGWRATLCGVEPVELQACHGQDHPPHALAHASFAVVTADDDALLVQVIRVGSYPDPDRKRTATAEEVSS